MTDCPKEMEIDMEKERQIEGEKIESQNDRLSKEQGAGRERDRQVDRQREIK